MNEDQVTVATTVAANEAPVSIKYAGFWARYAAMFIDGIVVFIPLVIVNAVIWGAAFLFGISEMAENALSLVLNVVNMIAGWAYYIVMTHKKGATVGKMALGMIVTSEKGGSATLGKIILRETVGKFVSGIIFCVGYIMAAFTAKKQALHDMMADTVVVYKDPVKGVNKKAMIWAIVCITVFFVGMIALFSAVVLLSLNEARAKGGDAAVKSTLSISVAQSLLDFDTNGTFAGSAPRMALPACSGSMITNPSEDGTSIALFAKSCTDEQVYYCAGYDSVGEEFIPVTPVSAEYALAGNSACPLTPASAI